MTQPAYLDDSLALSEAEQASARNAARVAGTPSADTLIAHLAKFGRDQSVLESALGLPIEEYRRVEAAFRQADPPPKPSAQALARRGKRAREW